MNESAIAEQEYKRLCNLINRIPYGECQLVALMIHRAIPNSEIVEGVVRCEDCSDVEHFWVRVNQKDIDPLSQDWDSIVVDRSVTSVVHPSVILEEYRGFIKEFPEPSEYSFFPLRWKIKEELL